MSNGKMAKKDSKSAERKEIKKHLGVVHLIAGCEDCEWESQSYKNGQALAAIHAKKHKHLVWYEIGLAGEYDGRA